MARERPLNEVSRIGYNTDRLRNQRFLHNHHPKASFPSPTREEIARGIYEKLAVRFQKGGQ